MRIQIINGPNLNLLGRREPDIYGACTFDDFLKTLRESYKEIQIDYFQSNVEGELINCLQKLTSDVDGVILNAAAYTHTSIALLDTILAIEIPVVEVHISNIHARESFRHQSMISSACVGVICGFGLDSYRLALESFLEIYRIKRIINR